MEKKFFSAVLILLILFCVSDFNSLAASYPDTVRVGLNYGSDAVSSVQVNAEKGLNIGYYGNNTFTLLYQHNSNKPVIIRKDGYFIRTENGIAEYSPTEGIPSAGQAMGPWHLKIGGTVADYDTAKSIAETYNKSGIITYVAYDGGWQVWAGFYPDKKSAENDIPVVRERLGVADISVLPETSKRLVIYDSAFNVILLYGGENGYLQVHPKPENNPYILTVNGKRYRNYIEIRRYTDSDLTLINILNIEEYLYGVVPSEIEADAPIEAIKAQAVAARTYTYQNIGKYEKWGFDLTDTVSSQVYNGYDAERPATNRAVDETRGQKIMYNASWPRFSTLPQAEV
ncbi:SpoIID/LytB domain-containing protein [Thermoclostridium stercorarium]|uniref:SpoIID/LytB domain-containing protein n=1 Tax=Thermoclostridium stercorarium TaxID=1510 RepID=UPI000AA97432|nr:SpoIID/LytB domain-containing protein [Thermoclostridium stercorarium]